MLELIKYSGCRGGVLVGFFYEVILYLVDDVFVLGFVSGVVVFVWWVCRVVFWFKIYVYVFFCSVLVKFVGVVLEFFYVFYI